MTLADELRELADQSFKTRGYSELREVADILSAKLAELADLFDGAGLTDERAAFEDWMKSYGRSTEILPVSELYASAYTQSQFDAWQAGRAPLLARIAERDAIIAHLKTVIAIWSA